MQQRLRSSCWRFTWRFLFYLVCRTEWFVGTREMKRRYQEEEREKGMSKRNEKGGNNERRSVGSRGVNCQYEASPIVLYVIPGTSRRSKSDLSVLSNKGQVHTPAHCNSPRGIIVPTVRIHTIVSFHGKLGPNLMPLAMYLAVARVCA